MSGVSELTFSHLPHEITAQIFDLFDDEECRPAVDPWGVTKNVHSVLPLLTVSRSWLAFGRPVLYRRLRLQFALGRARQFGTRYPYRTLEDTRIDRKCAKLVKYLNEHPDHLLYLKELHLVFPEIVSHNECDFFYQLPEVKDVERMLCLIRGPLQKLYVQGFYRFDYTSQIQSQIIRLQVRSLTLGGQWGWFVFQHLPHNEQDDEMRQLTIRDWSMRYTPDVIQALGVQRFLGTKLESLSFIDCKLRFDSSFFANLFSRPIRLKNATFAIGDLRREEFTENPLSMTWLVPLLLTQAASLESVSFTGWLPYSQVPHGIPDFTLLSNVRNLTITEEHLRTDSPALMSAKLRNSTFRKLTILSRGQLRPQSLIKDETVDWILEFAQHRIQNRWTDFACTFYVDSEKTWATLQDPYYDDYGEYMGSSRWYYAVHRVWPWHAVTRLRPLVADANISLEWKEPFISHAEWDECELRAWGRGGWPEDDEAPYEERWTLFEEESETDSFISDGLEKCEFDQNWASMWDYEKYRRDSFESLPSWMSTDEEE